jgi:hypothetical protein
MKNAKLAKLKERRWHLAQGIEWIKLITEKFLHYMETPRKIREQTKSVKKKSGEPWQYRWFGMLPVAIKMWMKSIIQKK